jgi:hypothetical protein
LKRSVKFAATLMHRVKGMSKVFSNFLQTSRKFCREVAAHLPRNLTTALPRCLMQALPGKFSRYLPLT